MARGRNSSLRRRRSSRRRSGAAKSVARLVGRIAQHAPYRGRAPNDPPSRVLSRQISLTLCYQVYLSFGISSAGASVSSPTPMAFGSVTIEVSSLTAKQPSFYFASKALTQGVISSLGFKPGVGYDIALRKVTVWGPSVFSDRTASLNAVTIAASGFGTDADATVMDVGTTSRRACASLRFPALNWLSHSSEIAAFDVTFGSTVSSEVIGVKEEVMPVGCLQISLSARPGYDIQSRIASSAKATIRSGSTVSKSKSHRDSDTD